MKKRKVRQFGPLSVFYACLAYTFLYLPVLVVIIYSFNSSERNVVWEGFTLKWYREMFFNEELMGAFRNTVLVALASTILSTVLGTLCAIGMQRFEFKLKKLLNTALYIPIVIPELVFAIAFLAFFSLLDIDMNMVTLIISHVTFSLPFVVITVRSRLAGMDPSIREAARDLGAGELHTFFRVTLPMISPAVIAGAMLALTLSLDDVVVSYFTAGPDSQTMPLVIMSMVKKGISPDVNALSTLMILGTFFILFFSTRIQNRLEAE
jgi:spermidine/putrescine transport system permease protein